MLAKFSVKKPYTVIVGIILVVVLGVISFTNMTTDLLPSMNIPYIAVYTTYIGSTPEQVESDITRPMESSFATLSGIKSINSTSSENLSLIIMEFDSDTDLDGVMIELSSKIDMLRGSWSDSVGSPVVMKINPDMMPVSIASVSLEGADVRELTSFVQDTLLPQLESVDGVASVSVSGAVEETVAVTIEQSRIDLLNSVILREVDAELADVESQLADAQAQISEGKRTLAREKSNALGKIDDMLALLGDDTLEEALVQARAQRDELEAQRVETEQAIAAMEALSSLTPEQKQQLAALEAQLASLRLERDQKQAQLDALESALTDPDAQQKYEQAVARRDEALSERAALEAYIEEQTIRDPDALRTSIAQLEEEIAQDETDLAALNAQIELGNTQAAALDASIAQLEAQIAAIEGTAQPSQSPEATGSVAPSASTAPEASGSIAPSASATPEASGSVAPSASASVSVSPDPTLSALPSTTPAVTPDATQSQDPATEIPETQPPASETPVTQVPETQAPTGETPVTQVPETQAPTGETPVTQIPETQAPTGETPETQAPPTQDTSTEPPVADSPSLNALAASDPAEEDDGQGLLAWLDPIAGASAEEASLEELKQQLEAARQQRDVLAQTLAQSSAQRDALAQALDEDRARLDRYRNALAQLEQSGEGENTQKRIEEAQRQIAALDEEIAALDATIAQIEAGQLPDDERAQQIEQLSQEIAALDASISAIEDSQAYQLLKLASDEDAYNAQYAQLCQARAQLEAGILQADEMIAKMESGVIPGGIIEGVEEDTSLEEARAQLESARSQAVSAFSDAQSQLNAADSELAQARSEFNQQRDEALENAGLDGVITMEMVGALIGAQNFSMPAGYAGEGDETYLVRVGDEFSSLDELRGMRLFSLGMETIDIVSLSDVASVEITDNADEVFTKVNGEDGLLLSFQKQSNQSTADVAARVSEALDDLSARYDGLAFAELLNQGEYIDIVIDSVIDNLLYGAVLAVIVLLIFLMDYRPTLIIALSIPVSVVIAFVAMYFSGITLNVLSMSGLALGIGMLVDNSIVAIENIYRLHNEEGFPVMRACVEGVKQISGALIASTLTTVCVFLPVVFVQGITRELFSDIGLTITYSLLASLLVAMTVVPSMSASVLKRSKPRKDRSDRLRNGYTKLLRGALRKKALILLCAVALLGVCVWQTMQMSMSFMPEVSSTQMTATLDFSDDMTTSQKQEASLSLMDQMVEVPGVQSVGMTAGSMMGLGTGDAQMGQSITYYILIDASHGRSNEQIGKDLAALDTRGLNLSVQTSSMDISMLSGDGVSINIEGDDLDALRETAAQVADIVRNVEGTADVSDGLEESEPELTIHVDKDAANEEGLTVAQVYQFVATKLADAQEITQITLDAKEYPVTVAERSNLEIKPEDIENLEIEVEREDETKLVRIGDIATVDETMSLSSINRREQRRSVSVSFDAADGYALSKVSDAVEQALESYTPPEGCQISLSGENETVRAIMDDLVLVILVALVFIFLIMVAQFQSFKSPIIVMFTIPLAFTGGLLALLITGMDLSVVAMVGFLLLCGVVVNNGIVFVDCINQLRIGGMAKREAIIETGRMRLRPILMTAMTTVLGMSTMALGTGMGAEMMQPMAVVSIGGLIYATIMTLFVVPILYDLLNGEKMKAREIEMIREAAGLRNDAELLGEAQAAPASPAGDSSAQAAGGQEAFPPPAQAPRPDAALTEAPQPEAPVPDVQPEAPQPEAPVSDAQPEAPQPEAPVPDAQPEGDKANAGKKKKKKGDDKDKKKKRKQKKRDED